MPLSVSRALSCSPLRTFAPSVYLPRGLPAVSPDPRSRKTLRVLPSGGPGEPWPLLTAPRSAPPQSQPVSGEGSVVERECLLGPSGRALHSARSPHFIPLLLPTSLAQRPSSLAPEFPALSLCGPASRGPSLSSAHTGPKPRLAGSCFSSGPDGAWRRGLGRCSWMGNSRSKAWLPLLLHPPGARPRQPGPLPNPGHSGLRLPCFFSDPSARVGWDPGCSVFYTADSFLGPYSWKRHFWV